MIKIIIISFLIIAISCMIAEELPAWREKVDSWQNRGQRVFTKDFK